MKKIMRKIALVLSLAMIFTALPMNVFAATTVTNETDLRAALASSETEVIVSGVIGLTSELELNAGKTLKGYVLGTLKVFGGNFVDPVIGPHVTADNSGKYQTTNGVFIIAPTSVTIVSGDIKIANDWRTLPSQTLIVKSGVNLDMNGKKFEVFGNTTVEAGTTVTGTVTLGGTSYDPTPGVVITTATITGPAGIDVVSGVEGYSVVYENGVYSLVETPAPTTHEHVWGYNTQYDAAAHWDYCHVCGAQNTPVAHSDANGDGVCECGWFISTTPSRVNPNTGVTAEMLG